MYYFQWGYTSFRKTGVVLDPEEGKFYNEYRAHFRTIPNRQGKWKRVTIKFYSLNPVLAMRAIVDAANRGISPVTFADTVVTGTEPLKAPEVVA